jgi:hypothetical protein
MKQYVLRQMPCFDLPDAAKPSGRSASRGEFSALSAWLFIKRLVLGHSVMTAAKRTLSVMVIGAMALAAGSVPTLAMQQPDANQAVQAAQQTPAQLQQLVAPFALYPDALVAQILAASTYPTQIVEAERWLQKHSKLQGEELAKEVNKESWDPSVKALTPFPSVLARMDQNLSWTSAVGDAYFNQQQDVLDAVQVMRKRAEDAGTLQSTPQQNVATQGSTIIIEPANPDVCYLPIYDPWTVYGSPLAVYPGFIFDPLVGPAFFFGSAIGLGYFGGYDWGWPAWGFNWGRREVIFNHNMYVSRSPSFFHRSPNGRGNLRPGQDGLSSQRNHDFGGSDHNHGNGFPNRDSGRGRIDGSPNPSIDRGHSGAFSTPDTATNRRDTRGFGEGSSSTGTRSGAFSGFGQGGFERGSASRGQSSFGRGGGFGGGRGFGGGGGMRGGGGGGRHR